MSTRIKIRIRIIKYVENLRKYGKYRGKDIGKKKLIVKTIKKSKDTSNVIKIK